MAVEELARRGEEHIEVVGADSGLLVERVAGKVAVGLLWSYKEAKVGSLVGTGSTVSAAISAMEDAEPKKTYLTVRE